MPTIQDGKDAVEQGNLQQARLIFEAILQETPRSEDAWLGLAEVLTDTEDQRICYENVLKINKNSRAAKLGLRNLEPQANPLIAALQEKIRTGEGEAVTGEVDNGASDRSTVIGSREEIATAMEAAHASGTADGPPMPALVAVGLALSVVVFAVGGGLIFIVLDSLAGG